MFVCWMVSLVDARPGSTRYTGGRCLRYPPMGAAYPESDSGVTLTAAQSQFSAEFCDLNFACKKILQIGAYTFFYI